jgi:hypothetical protein
MKVEAHGAAETRQIGEGSDIATVDARRERAAERTRCLWKDGHRDESDLVGSDENAKGVEQARVGEEQLGQHTRRFAI